MSSANNIQHLEDPNTGFRYAYKIIEQTNGRGNVPLVCLTHFRASFAFWHTTLLKHLSSSRPLILFEYVGVGYGAGGGRVASSAYESSEDLAAFLELLAQERPEFSQGVFDVLGFSIGGMVAQLLALNHPQKVRKLILAGTTPSAGDGILQTPNDLAPYAVGKEPSVDDLLTLFYFKDVQWSRKSGEDWYNKHVVPNPELFLSYGYRDGGAGIQAQLGYMRSWSDAETSQGKHGSYARLGELKQPVFVAQGQDDFMIPTVNSFVMQHKLPNAHLHIYPEAGHGFLYQWAELFAQHCNNFLGGSEDAPKWN